MPVIFKEGLFSDVCWIKQVQIDRLLKGPFYISVSHREKLEKYPLKICFDQYAGANRYEAAISFIEERFRAHFQRSRTRAKKARDFEDAPYLYKTRPQMPTVDEMDEESDSGPTSK